MRIQWIALTGTPGVGKSRLARTLRAGGWLVVDGNRFAKEQHCLVGTDARRRSRIVDTDRVGQRLHAAHPKPGPVAILESHWAHEVPGMDAAIVLRVHPSKLAARLRRRRWPRAKVHENVQAEALDVILQECAARFGAKRVGEIDATRRSPAALARLLGRVLRAPERELMKLEIGRIDWSQELLKWS